MPAFSPLTRPPVIALAFAAGIAWHGPQPGSLLPPLVALAALAVLGLRRGAPASRRTAAGLSAVMVVGIATAALRSPRPWSHDSERPGRDARVYQGLVTRPASPRPSGFELRVLADEQTVRVYSSVAARPGDVVRITGRLRPLRGARNFGGPDRAALARADGFDADLSADSLEVVGRRAGLTLSVWRAVGALRERFRARIMPVEDAGSSSSALGPGGASPASSASPAAIPSVSPAAIPSVSPAAIPSASPASSPSVSPASSASPAGLAEPRAVLLGVTLGLRAGVSRELDERWRAVGVYHVLSVSGLHLAVVALLAFTGLRRLAAALGTRVDPARVALGPALLLATGYTMLTGAEVATLRALVVASLWMIGVALGRPVRLLDALGLAALLLLLWSPAQLWQPSFQLSFAAGLALALAPGGEPAPSPAPSRLGRARQRAVRWVARGILSSAAVVLVTAPITAYHFHQVQPGGVLGNLVVTPLLELAALPLGLLGLGLSELWSPLGAALLDAATSIIAVADAIAARMQPVCPVGQVAIAAPAVAVAIWLVATGLCAWRGRRAVKLAGWAALCALWWCAPLPPPVGVRVTFFDVGQGDAALIETPSELWLVDAGGAPGASSAEFASAPGRAILQVLELTRRRRIDLAIVSHPHPDHYLGLLALLGEVPITELWLPEGFVDVPAAPWPAAPSTSTPGAPGAPAMPSFMTVVSALARAGTVVRAPPPQGRTSRELASLAMIAPRYRPPGAVAEKLAADPVRSVNDNSAVVTLEYAGRRVLFPGDVELEGEETLLRELPTGALRSAVVKVPHHGSRTSSGRAFVRAVAAELAVISCGAGNRFGFPVPEVVARWQAHGAQVVRTDQGGAVRVEISPGGRLEVQRP